MKASVEGVADLAHEKVQQATSEDSGIAMIAGMAHMQATGQLDEQAARSMISKLGDHFSGVVYVGLVMVLGVVMFTKTGNAVNASGVDNIVSTLTDTISTGASLIILLVLAIIFGYALFYMDFATGTGGSKSKT